MSHTNDQKITNMRNPSLRSSWVLKSIGGCGTGLETVITLKATQRKSKTPSLMHDISRQTTMCEPQTLTLVRPVWPKMSRSENYSSRAPPSLRVITLRGRLLLCESLLFEGASFSASHFSRAPPSLRVISSAPELLSS